MDVKGVKITAVIQYSPLPGNVGPWVMDLRFEQGKNTEDESWAAVSYSDCVSALIRIISKRQPPFVEIV